MTGFAVTAAALTALSVSSAQAAVLVSTGFTNPPYSDGALNASTDTTTAGQDGWLNTSGGGTNNISVQNSALNGFVSLTTSGQDVRKPFDGGAIVNSGSVYLSATVTLSAAQATGDYFIHLGDGGASNFYARTYAKLSGAGFVLAEGTSSGTPVTYGTTVLPFNTPFNLLIRYDFVTGTGNDTGALFVNPTTADGSGDTPYVAATTIGTDATSIGGVYLRQGSASNAPTVSSIDNISVSGTAAVPEPASLALIGLAGLSTLRRRRA